MKATLSGLLSFSIPTPAPMYDFPSGGTAGASAKTIAQDVIDGGQPLVPSLFSKRPVTAVELVAVAVVLVAVGVVPDDAPFEEFKIFD